MTKRIFSLILRLCMAAGLSDEQAYAALPVFQCLISYAAGLLTFVSVREVTGDGRLALTAHGMFLLLIGLSPWVSIPYSDAAGIVLPVLIFRLSTLRPRTLGKNALRWFIIGLLGVFGYRLKPTIFIVLPAVCLGPAWRDLFLVLSPPTPLFRILARLIGNRLSGLPIF